MPSEGYNDRHQEEDRNWMVAGRTGMGGTLLDFQKGRGESLECYNNVSENNCKLSSTS